MNTIEFELNQEVFTQHFKDYGWSVSEKIFSDEEIDEIFSVTELFYEGKKDRELPKKIREEIDWRPELGGKMRINDYIDYQMHEIRKLVTAPTISRQVSLLISSPEVYIFNSSLFSKPPFKGHNETGWHYDETYLNNCSSQNMITAWIPLQDIGLNDSPMLMISGSHKWELSEADEYKIIESIPYVPERGLYKDITLDNGEVHNIKVQPLVMRKGQVSFHHIKTLHARCANYSEVDVRAISVHYQCDNNLYKEWLNTRDFYICKNANEELCRKLPDGSPNFYDPEFCPKIWPIDGQPKIHAR